MTVFEKAKRGVVRNDISAQELYDGIAFLYYCDIVTLEEYNALMDLFFKNIPDF